MRWKSSEYKKQMSYDCTLCKRKGLFKDRICFLLHKTNKISFPVFETKDLDGNDLIMPKQALYNGKYVVDEREVDVDGVYDWLDSMYHVFPDVPSLEILTTYLRKVCPESLLDLRTAQICRIEQAVKIYGFDILDVPVYLFDAFEAVRAGENMYENIENHKREQALKNQN